MSETNTPVDRVISKIGSKKRVADLLNVHPSVITRWRTLVPSKHQATLMRLNKKESLGLERADFFEDAEGGQA